MGIVWETYHKGVQSLGVPENLTDEMRKVTPPLHRFVWRSKSQGRKDSGHETLISHGHFNGNFEMSHAILK